MTLFFAVIDYLADPYVLVLWCAVMIAFAYTWFPWDPQPKITVPHVKLTKERREITIGYERQEMQ